MDDMKPLGGHEVEAGEGQRHGGHEQGDDAPEDPPSVVLIAEQFDGHPAREDSEKEAHELAAVEEEVVFEEHGKSFQEWFAGWFFKWLCHFI